VIVIAGASSVLRGSTGVLGAVMEAFAGGKIVRKIVHATASFRSPGCLDRLQPAAERILRVVLGRD
jgi:hypothetical protein